MCVCCRDAIASKNNQATFSVALTSVASLLNLKIESNFKKYSWKDCPNKRHNE